jgi:hypothetical protein
MAAPVEMISARRRLSQLRREVAERTVLVTPEEVHSAGVSFRAEQPFSDMLARMDRGDGGLLCGHSALMLWRAIFDDGFPVWTVHFGFESPLKMTHVGVIVLLQGQHYFYDPYFNFEFVNSFEETLNAYRFHGRLDILDDGHTLRKTYLQGPLRAETLRRHGWRFSQDGLSLPTIFPSLSMAAFHLSGYCSTIESENLREFTELGLAARFENIFLFPYAVHNLPEGYVDDPEKSTVLAHLISITGCQGKADAMTSAHCFDSRWHDSIGRRTIQSDE